MVILIILIYIGDASSGKFEVPIAILGLYDVEIDNEGSSGIKVYNRPIEEMKITHLRRNCGYLYTDAKLFSGTVRENIDPTNTIKNELLIAALHWLKIFDVLDPEQKVLDGFEDRIEDDEVVDTDWDKVERESKPIEMEDVNKSNITPAGSHITPKSKGKKSSSHKLAKLAGENKDFISFLTTYHIANKTEKRIL